jgi:23S rRNA (adenine2030-N6)-methyltransferase
MKYRHAYHAGNFADVHKHVTWLALVRGLQRKDKGLRVLDTHAGRGAYDRLPDEAAEGVERLLAGEVRTAALASYAEAVRAHRALSGHARGYPGSPALVQASLRPQDRAVFVEWLGIEAQALGRLLGDDPRVRVECGDGFTLLAAHLPPPERRGLVLVDPPYEDARDWQRTARLLEDGLRRFATGVFAVWYPLKDERESARWLAALAGRIGRPALVSELWLHPRDTRIRLNGSGIVVVNPPWQLEEQMREWLPELLQRLDAAGTGGADVRPLQPAN